MDPAITEITTNHRIINSIIIKHLQTYRTEPTFVEISVESRKIRIIKIILIYLLHLPQFKTIEDH